MKRRNRLAILTGLILLIGWIFPVQADRTPIDQGHDQFDTVHGSFERDLTRVDFNTIPRSPQQAQEALQDAQAQSGKDDQP